MIQILQVHSDANFRQALSDHCSDLPDLSYHVARDTTDLLNFFDESTPDLVLLDLDLQPQAGLELLAKIRARWSNEEVKVLLLVAETTQEHVLTYAAELGADYCMHLPMPLSVLETRVRQLVGGAAAQGDLGRQRNFARRSIKKSTKRQVQEKCTTYFEDLGIPPHYKGYRYLVEGIWLASLHPSWLNAVTQHLYPAIGEQFEVNTHQVERAMRYALDVTWEKGNVDRLYELFPFVRENKGKPTNSDFIARMVHFIWQELGEVV